HGVDVLDAADDDAVVLAVADDFELVLLPADDGLVDLDLPDHGGAQAAGDDVLELLAVVGDAAAGAAEGEGGADDGGQADLVEEGEGVVEGGDGLCLGETEPDLFADLAELVAVLGAMDDAPVGADHLDVELGEGAGVPEVAGDVEGGLAAEGGEDRVDGGSEVAFLLDDLADGLWGDGLDVGSIREGRIGHDGGGVGVDEDDAVPLLLEGLARLHAGVVELAA